MSVVIKEPLWEVPSLHRGNQGKIWGGDMLKKIKYATFWISMTRVLKVSFLGGFAEWLKEQ